MTASPKVVAIDLDGTLIRSDGGVSDRSRAAIAATEDAGAMVVFVTGRPPRWMTSVSDATGHRGLAVCANGAYVYDLHQRRIVREYLLQPAIARQLVQRLRSALPELAFAVERGRDFGHEPGYRPRSPTPEGTLVAAVEALVDQPVAKLLARHEGLDADELLAQARQIVGELATLTHSSREGLLEVSAAGISKASTLEAVCAEHGHGAADVVAFGDMPNDLPMLAWAGRSVAVANAHPDVLTVVDEITLSNDEDGVAVVLERFYK